MAHKDPERARQYEREKYLRLRERILAKRRERYYADLEAARAKNVRIYERNRESILARQKAYRSQPDVKAKRQEYDKRHHFLKIYGVEHPEVNQRSLDGQSKHRRCAQCPPKPPPQPKPPRIPRSTLSSRAIQKSGSSLKRKTKKKRSRSRTKPSQATGGAKSMTSVASKPTWTPSPVTGFIPPPKKATTFLCPAGHQFPTKAKADRCKHAA